MTITKGRSRTSSEGERAARVSIRLLWWVPLSVIVGFVFASWFFSEPWSLWQVVSLAVILATPFGIGAYYGLRAVRLGESRGWIGLAPNAVFMAIALIMPITEALTTS